MPSAHGAIGGFLSAVGAEPERFFFRVEIAVFVRLPSKPLALVLIAVDPSRRRLQAIDAPSLLFVPLVVATLRFGGIQRARILRGLSRGEIEKSIELRHGGRRPRLRRKIPGRAVMCGQRRRASDRFCFDFRR